MSPRIIAALTDRELDTAIWAKRGLLEVAHGEGRDDIEAELAALLAEQERRCGIATPPLVGEVLVAWRVATGDDPLPAGWTVEGG